MSGEGIDASSHSVTLSWTSSSSAVIGYDVYRSEVSGGPYTKLDTSVITTTTYTDADVQAGMTYYYVVTSATASGVQSADSAQISATIPTS
jgi:fibronectin type 3 domain-containing protein